VQLPPRRDNLERFTTFLVAEMVAGRHLQAKWQVDVGLRRNFTSLPEFEVAAALAEALLAELRERNESLKMRHLSAYLQEYGYWATQKIYRRLGGRIGSLDWGDFFGLAGELVAKPLELLKQYRSLKGATIGTYAQWRLEERIANTVYRFAGWQRITDWRLLCDVSRLRLRVALGENRNSREFSRCLLAWEAFRSVYVPNLAVGKVAVGKNHRQYVAPDRLTLAKMVVQFDLLAKAIDPPLPPTSAAELELLLGKCITAARQHINPQLVEYPEDFEPISTNEPLEALLIEEVADAVGDVATILTRAFGELSASQQTVILLWKGLQLTQTEIANIFAVKEPNFIEKQFHVARQIDRCRTQLLRVLIATLVPKDSIDKERIAALKPDLDDWLERYCRGWLNRQLFGLRDVLDRPGKTDLDIPAIATELKLVIAANLGIDFSQTKSIDGYLIDYLMNRFNVSKKQAFFNEKE
jgi:hypothetical protein